MKTITLAILSFALISSTDAYGKKKVVQEPVKTMELLPEVRAAYFYPTNHTYRKTYGGGGLYSAEFSAQAWNYFYPWASAGFCRQSGHSIGEKNATEITFVPLAIGLKYIYPFKKVCLYLGAGFLSTWAHTHNHSEFVTKKISRWGFGGIVKSGILWYVTRDFFFDFFCDYSYMKIDYNRHHNNVVPQTLDLSGISAGFGLGYRF